MTRFKNAFALGRALLRRVAARYFFGAVVEHDIPDLEIRRKRFPEIIREIIVPDEKCLSYQAERLAIYRLVDPEDFLPQPHFSRIPEMFAVSRSELFGGVNSEGAIKVSDSTCIRIIDGV